MSSPAALCLSRFEFEGSGAAEFLQGQLSVDIKKLDKQAQLASICDLKGRAQFVLWVEKASDERFILAAPASLQQSLQRHINKYAAFAQAKLSDPSAAYLSLASADNPLSKQAEGLTIPRFTLSENPKAALSTLDLLQYWIPVIDAQNSGHFQPQQLRLHEFGAVHYDKGCYLGQEVVARLWFKSAPKAWTHLIEVELPEQTELAIAAHVERVYSVGALHLVVARPEALEQYAKQTGAIIHARPAYLSAKPARVPNA